MRRPGRWRSPRDRAIEEAEIAREKAVAAERVTSEEATRALEIARDRAIEEAEIAPREGGGGGAG